MSQIPTSQLKHYNHIEFPPNTITGTQLSIKYAHGNNFYTFPFFTENIITEDLVREKMILLIQELRPVVKKKTKLGSITTFRKIRCADETRSDLFITL